MRWNRAVVFFCFISIVLAQELTKDYPNIKILFSRQAIIGQDIKISVNAGLPKIKYVFSGFSTGESYFFQKTGETYSADFKVPYYFTEGKKNFVITLVLEPLDQASYDNLVYQYRNNPNIQIERHVDLTMLKINEDLLALAKETAVSEIKIQSTPREVQAGQKVNINVQIAELARKVSLVYRDKTIPLRQETDTIWTGEMIAGKESKYKVYILKNDNKLQVEEAQLLILPERAFIQPEKLVENKPAVVPTNNVLPAEKFKIKGNKTIVFINKSKEGEVNFTEEHRREESLNLDITGKEGDVNVEAKIFSTTQENVDKKEDIRIRMFTDIWETYLGDFTQTCTDNEFTFRNKNLSGFRFSYFPQKTYAMVLTATERGTDRWEYFYGNDSQGPYYLGYVPVVIGSEKIYLDGQLQRRDLDYIIEYKSGKITFQHNVVQTFQLIKVLYESENENMRSKYTALRWRQDYDWLVLGISGLERREPNNLESATRHPQDIKQYGIDTKIKFGNIAIELEEAKEDINENILEKSPTRNTAQAHYKKITYDDQKVLKFSMATKLTDLDFNAIGNNDLRRGLDLADNMLELNSSENNVLLRGEQLKEKYQEDAIYKNYSGYYKFYRREDNLPEVKFWVKENSRKILTVITENRVLETAYHAENVELTNSISQNVKLGIKGGRETQEDLLAVDYPYKKSDLYGAFIKTEKIRGFDFIIGADHQENKYLNEEKKVSLNAKRDESYTKLNFYPDYRWRTGLAYREIKDTYSGNSEIVDFDYTIQPGPDFSTLGQYSLTSLKETFVSQSYRVQKQKGSFALKYQPWDFFKLNLRYNPNQSIVKAERDIVNSSVELKNANVDLSPWNNLSLKYNLLDNHSYTKNPAYNFILSSEDQTISDVYILRALPHEKVDLELRSRYTRKIDNDLNDTNTANMFYTDGKGYETEKGIAIYTRWTRELLLSLDYARMYEIMDYQNAPSLNIKLNEDKYGFDAKYKYDLYWTYHLFGSYARRENLLVTENNITYEYSPGAGVAYRILNFKISYDYTYIETTMGEETLKHKHDLSLTYDFNTFINLVANAQHIDSLRPRYKTTDVLVKFSATF